MLSWIARENLVNLSTTMKKIDLYPFLRLVSSQRRQLFYEISLLSTAFKKSAVFQNFYRANRNALPEPILSMFNRKYGNEFFLFSIYLIKHEKMVKDRFIHRFCSYVMRTNFTTVNKTGCVDWYLCDV